MLTHKEIWRGIDQLAVRNGLSPSGLAKRAGLDPTTFNKSKRVTKEGKLRWPSTESLAKILEATSTPMADFVGLIGGNEAAAGGTPIRLKSIRLSQINRSDDFDASGFLTSAREEIEFPTIDEPNAYIIELDADMAEPCYRIGDLVVVSPGSSIRRHDRVMVRRKDGAMQFGIFNRRTTQRLPLLSIDPSRQEVVLNLQEVLWVARVLWVSQ